MQDPIPMVAILRGIEEHEIIEHGEILLNAGYNMIEVPLNSPNPFASIKKLVNYCGNNAYIGAGTITKLEYISPLKETGANLAITPNLNLDILKALTKESFFTYPGVFSPSEAFTALKYQPAGLKIFPADSLGARYIKNIRAILPKDIQIIPVGGICVGNMAEFWSAGASGFGLGSALYKPQMNIADFKSKAHDFMDEFNRLRNL
ncbi:MAG: 2-dehydro-3-deoxy-6-phosphogalactonate aldolase [Alphaproteobacteria bacterium]